MSKVAFGSVKRGTGSVTELVKTLGSVQAVSVKELGYKEEGNTSPIGIGVTVYHSTKASQLTLTTISALVAWFEKDRLNPGAYDFLMVALADTQVSRSTEQFRVHVKAMASLVVEYVTKIAERRAAAKAAEKAAKGVKAGPIKKPKMPSGYVRLPEILAGYDMRECVYLDNPEDISNRERRIGALTGIPLYWSGRGREVSVLITTRAGPARVNAVFFDGAVHPLAGQTAFLSAGVLLFNGTNEWSDISSWLSVVSEVVLTIDDTLRFENTHVTVYTPDAAGHVLVGLWQSRDLRTMDRFYLNERNDQSGWREVCAIGVPGLMQMLMLLRHVVSQVRKEDLDLTGERTATLYMTSSGYLMRPAHLPLFAGSTTDMANTFLRYAAWNDSTVAHYYKMFVIASMFYDRMLQQYLPGTLSGYRLLDADTSELEDRYRQVILEGEGANITELVVFVDYLAKVLDTRVIAQTIHKV